MCERVNADGWSLAKRGVCEIKAKEKIYASKPTAENCRVNAIEIHTLDLLEFTKSTCNFL